MSTKTWEVLLHPAASDELAKLPPRERSAMDHAFEKLRASGPLVPHPHSSNVQGASNIRELRPRAGNCPWRGFYRQVAEVIVIGAIGPEAKQNRRGFDRAIGAAQDRLDEIEQEGDDA
jgi:hypothetical protein